jgi:hypothetical protein
MDHKDGEYLLWNGQSHGNLYSINAWPTQLMVLIYEQNGTAWLQNDSAGSTAEWLWAGLDEASRRKIRPTMAHSEPHMTV